MTTVLQPGKIGEAEIQHFDVGVLESRISALRPGEYCPAGRYAKLLVSGHLVMSDTRREQCTNITVVNRARGRVLIGGLGLGMILIPILQKREVTHVTVIERSPDVVALVQPQIERWLGSSAARKLTVHVGDIRSWRPAARGRQFETIYFDIWSETSTDDLSDMTKLRRAFAPFLVVGGWAGCWAQDHLRDRRRLGM